MATLAAPISVIWSNRPTLKSTQVIINDLTSRLTATRLGDTDKAELAGFHKDGFQEIKARTAECVSLNYKIKELLANYRDLENTASTLAESAAAIATMEATSNSTNMAKHKANIDALMAWAIEEKPAFVSILKSLGNELPPQMEAALERVHVAVPDSQPSREAEQRSKELHESKERARSLENQVESLKTDLRASREEIEDFSQRAQAQEKDKDKLQGELSEAKVIKHDLQQRLQTQELLTTSQADELVKVTEISRVHERRANELRVEINELLDLKETARLEAIEASKESDRIIRKNEEDKETLEIDRNRLQQALNSADQKIGRLNADIEHDAKIAEQKVNALKAQNAEREKTLTDQRDGLQGALDASKQEAVVLKDKSKSDAELAQQEIKRLQEAHDKVVKTLDQVRAERNGEWEAYQENTKKCNDTFKEVDDQRKSLIVQVSALRHRRGELETKVESLEKNLSDAKDDLASRDQDISSLTKSCETKDADLRELQEKMDRSRSTLQRFLVGHETIDKPWSEALASGVMQYEDIVLEARLEAQSPDWKLLPCWSEGSEGRSVPRDIKCLVFTFLTLFREHRWDKSAYESLRSLKRSLLGSTAAELPQWLGRFYFHVMAHAISRESPCLMVRVAAWQIIWLLDQRWKGMTEKAVIQAMTDDLSESLRRGEVDFGTDGLLHPGGAVQLFCPMGEKGVVVINHNNRTLQWAPRDRLQFEFNKILLHPVGSSTVRCIEVELNIEEQEWTFKNLV